MTVRIDLLDDRTAGAWDAFVASFPEATFFHRAGWRRVIDGAFRQDAPFLYAERDGAIVGVLPLVHMRSRIFGNRLVSTAFTVGGGSVAVDEEARGALDDAAVDMAKRTGADYLEYRQPAHPHVEGDGWHAREGLHATFERPLPAKEEDDWKAIPAKKRRLVRKAIESGLKDEVDDGIGRFYPVFAEAMRDLGTPVFGRRLFELLMQNFGKDCECMVVTQAGKPVTVAINFFFRDRVMQYFLGNLKEARPLNATNFLLWRLGRRAAERGLTVFDYGRSKVGSGNYVFKVEAGFFAKPVVHEYFLGRGQALPDIDVRNPRYQQAIAAWKHLPLPIANVAGPLLSRHIG